MDERMVRPIPSAEIDTIIFTKKITVGYIAIAEIFYQQHHVTSQVTERISHINNKAGIADIPETCDHSFKQHAVERNISHI
jgi:hypothetical protein